MQTGGLRALKASLDVPYLKNVAHLAKEAIFPSAIPTASSFFLTRRVRQIVIRLSPPYKRSSLAYAHIMTFALWRCGTAGVPLGLGPHLLRRIHGASRPP